MQFKSTHDNILAPGIKKSFFLLRELDRRARLDKLNLNVSVDSMININ